MNKKQMLKEQKRIKLEQKESQKMFRDDKEVYNVFKIALGVIVFIGLSFAVINITNGTWNLFSTKSYDTQIDSTKVIVGNMFNKADNEYLVLAYDMSDDKNDYYSALTQDYYNAEKKLYFLDLSSGFNQNNIGEKTIVSNDLDKLKIASPTLFVIKGNNISKTYTTEKDITNYFMSEK